MCWDQIAVADGQPSDKREIRRVAQRPVLETTDQRAEPQLKQQDPRQDRPYDADFSPQCSEKPPPEQSRRSQAGWRASAVSQSISPNPNRLASSAK